MTLELRILRSGSSGNCTLLSVGDTHVLIDAGIGPRVLAKELAFLGLAFKDLSAAVFTHCHGDHLQGNTFAELAHAGVSLHLPAQTWRMARKRWAAIQRMPLTAVRLFEVGDAREAQAIQFSAFSVCHGEPGPDNPAGEPVGFVFGDGNDTLAYCTDIGHVGGNVLDALKRASLIVLESNHDPELTRLSSRPYHTKRWILSESGHLSNEQAASALAEVLTGREGAGVVLAHLSETSNAPDMALEMARSYLDGRCEVALGVANRRSATVPWRLKNGAVESGLRP